MIHIHIGAFPVCSPVSINVVIVKLSFHRVNKLHGKWFICWCGFRKNFKHVDVFMSVSPLFVRFWNVRCSCLLLTSGENVFLSFSFDSQEHFGVNVLFYFFRFFFWSVSQPEFSSVIPFLKILAWQHVLTRPVWELHLNINMYRWLKRLQQYKQLLNSEELSSKSWICVLSSFTGPETWSNSHDDDDDDDITQSLCQGKHIWELI